MNNTKIVKLLIIIPKKERIKILKYYHKITGHKNYNILHEKIIAEGYYWNDLTQSCKVFVKNCEICVAKNRTNILPPPTNLILCDKPKELYLIDITELPTEFLNDDKDKLISAVYNRSFFKICL